MRNNDTLIPKTQLRKNVSAFFFISALCFSSWTSRISFIQESLSLNDGQFGLLLFCLPFGVLLSLPISSNLVKRYGSRRILIFGTIALTATLLMLSTSNNVYLTGLCLVLFGFSNNATNLSANLQAVETERIFGKSIMGSFHGIWSVSALFGSLFGSFCMSLHLPVYFQFLSIVAVVITVLIISHKYLIYDDETNTSAHAFVFKFGDKNVLILGIIALCSMMGEGSMYDWSEIYLKRTVESNHFLSSIGYSMFMFSMMTGRFVSDFQLEKLALLIQ
ncbi:MFS transporter [Sphingobacterium sp. KU25419]|nr:MFS transporter [Sphingobacterium sp. KU25419]